MEYYNLNYLKKVDINGLMNNENNYRKYIVNKIIEQSKITEECLNPVKLLQIYKKYNKNIFNKTIVVKISKKYELLNKDYEISKKLEELKCINFAKYLGFFSCKDDINNYNLEKPLPKYFCKNNGTINYFLFMEYYEIGSIVNYKPEKIEEIISIINQVIGSMTSAFEKLGFIHGDLHTGNILIKKIKKNKITYKYKYKYQYQDRISEINTHGIQIVLFDFDRSNFSNDFGMLLNEILTFINLYDSYLLESKILKVNNISITPLRTLKKELYKVINIDGLKNIIGE